MRMKLIQGLLVSLALGSLAIAADDSPKPIAEATPPVMGVPEKPDPGTTKGPGVEIRTGGTDTTVAPSGSGNPVTTTNQKPSTVNVSGKVETVDRTNGRLWVRDSDGIVRQYHVNPDTVFTSNNRQVKFSDLKPGDPITFDQSILR